MEIQFDSVPEIFIIVKSNDQDMDAGVALVIWLHRITYKKKTYAGIMIRTTQQH